MIEMRLVRGLGVGAAISLVLAGAACNRPPPPPSNTPAEVVCQAGDAACLAAQAKANEEVLERQILEQHAAEVNAAMAANATDANALDSNAAIAPGAVGSMTTLADGAYECSDGQHVTGTIDIRRGAFRYQPLGAFSGAFAPYQIDDRGHIQWGAALEGLNDTPPELITESTVEPWGFDVKHQANPGSPPEIMRCRTASAKAPGK